MKRLILVLAVVALPFLAACEPPPGSPPCTDIVGGGGVFTETGTVLWADDLAGNPCTYIRYRIHVLDGERGPQLGQSTYRGTNNLARVDYGLAVSDDDTTVCVWTETIDADGSKLDRAPDTGCASITVGEASSGRPHR